MAQVTILDVPVDISGSGVRTLPVVSAGTDRKQVVIIASGLTGSSVAVPTALVCDGQSATYEAGATVTGARTAITAFSFTDSQIATFTARQLTITGGDTQRRVISTFSIQNTDQAISNTWGFFDSGVSNSAGSPVSLVRSANSFTFACVKTMGLVTSTMSNPIRVGSFDTASSRFSYGYQNDTANTSDTTFSHSAVKIYEIAVNFKEASGSVVDINGDSSNPDINVGTNTVNTDGLGTITSCVIETATKGSISIALSLPSGDGDFVITWPPADGAEYPYFGAVTATFGNGTTSAQTGGTFIIPAGTASTTIADAVNNSAGYLGTYITLLDSAKVYVETGDAGSGILTIGTDGLITASKALTREIYVHQPDDFTVDTHTLVVNGGGDVVVDGGGLTSSGLTSIGLTRVGLTSSGL